MGDGREAAREFATKSRVLPPCHPRPPPPPCHPRLDPSNLEREDVGRKMGEAERECEGSSAAPSEAESGLCSSLTRKEPRRDLGSGRKGYARLSPWKMTRDSDGVFTSTRSNTS